MTGSASVPASLVEGQTRIRRLPRNAGLDILRILSICGVVAIHVFGIVVGAAPQASRNWWVAVALDIGFIWVVPVFVMISGALILGSSKLIDSPARFYRARALRLVPALIAWNLIYLLGVRIWLREERLDLPRILQLLTDGSVFTQLYFLWLILGLYAVAPILASFLRNGSNHRALIFGSVVLGVTVLAYMTPGLLGLFSISRPISLNFLTQWLPYVGYFLLGYALRNVRLSGVRLAIATLLTFGAAIFVVWQYGHKAQFPVLTAISSVSYLGPMVALLSLGIFVVSLSLFKKVEFSGRPSQLVRALSEASFGVFLIHLVIFEVIRLNVPTVASGLSLTAMGVVYLVTVLLSFGISLLAAKVPGLRLIF